MPDVQMLDNVTTLKQGWTRFRIEKPNYASERSRKQGFLRWVARQTGEHLDVVTGMITFCDGCSRGTLLEDTVPGQTGPICSDCISAYETCLGCNERSLPSLWIGTLGEIRVCLACIRRDYLNCRSCDGYYHRAYRANHRHNVRSCCASAQHVFTIPHIGHDPLRNDTRTRVSLPSGEITNEGIESIRNQIRNQYYYSDRDVRNKWIELAVTIEELGMTWQTKRGNYVKRLSSHAHKKYGLKIPPEVMTMVGNIARDNSQGIDFDIEVTRELNRGARAFGYAGSCWWQSYSRSRCAHKTNGGFALRTFSGEGVTGRAWVLPLKLEDGRLTPTYETMTPDAYVTFNGYGNLQSYTPVRILSHMTGMTYRKVTFSCDPMYINSAAGYLAASEEVAKNYTDGSLNLYLDRHSTLYRRENPRPVLLNA